MAKTINDAVKALAEKCITNALFSDGDRNRKVSAEYLIEDGRLRKKLWRELLKTGYLNATENDGEALLTEKAFDELPVEGFVLGDLYKYDNWESRQGKVYVVWDRLTTCQKKAVILAMRENPMSYTLSVVDDHYNPPKAATFKLGGGSVAMESVGGWGSGKIVLTDATVTEKHAKADREHYRAECVGEGLNWFLHKINAIDPEETVPVASKQPMLGGGASIDRDPANWAASLPNAIERTKDTIQKARQRLLALEKLEQAVEKAGGWEAFKGQYEAAIDAYVEAKMQE